MTWILILTLMSPATNGGAAIHSVPDFKTRKACEEAADAWLRAKDSNFKASAICVERK